MRSLINDLDNEAIKRTETILPHSVLETFKRPSNQIIVKNDDGSLDGLRYVVATEPSTLRPIKSWTINIEKWHSAVNGDIETEDILLIRLLNIPTGHSYTYQDYIKDVFVRDQKIFKDNDTSFNAVMAAGIFINKIDAGRMPDIKKTLNAYKLM